MIGTMCISYDEKSLEEDLFPPLPPEAAYVTNLAVDGRFRRQGVAAALLSAGTGVRVEGLVDAVSRVQPVCQSDGASCRCGCYSRCKASRFACPRHLLRGCLVGRACPFGSRPCQLASLCQLCLHAHHCHAGCHHSTSTDALCGHSRYLALSADTLNQHGIRCSGSAPEATTHKPQAQPPEPC